MKVVFAISILCFFVIGVFAQDGATLTGKTTQSGGSPDAGVSVTLVSRRDKSISFSTVSDENGLYRFENVPPGKYVLTAFASGGMREVASSATVNISLGDREKAVEDLELLPPWPIHEEVTVSADTTQPIDEVAKTVNVIDGQEMRDRADLSLLDTLRTIPGFRVQQLGGFGRTSSIKTRGLRNQDTALLIDGVRFRDVSSITGDASAFLSDLTLTSVSRVEVLRGSGSSLYGTNAIGGTIDFQTPVPQSGIHGQVSGALGELRLRRFRGNISKGLSDGKFGINFGVARTIYTRGIDGDDDAKNLNVQSRIEFNPTKRTNISARFFVSRANVRLNSDPDTFGTLPPSNAAIISAEENVNFVPDLDDPDNLQGSRFFNGQVALSHIFSPELVFSGYYSGLKTSRRNDNGPLGVGFQSASTSIFDGTIHTVNGHLNWTPDRTNEIKAGYEFEAERFGNDGTTPSGADTFFTRARQSSHTIFAQDLLHFLKDRLQVAVGARAQFFSLSTPEFSLANAPYSDLVLDMPPAAYTFDGAVSYFFRSTHTKLRAHVGNGYRVPSLYERFGTFYSSFGTPSFVALGDPHLKPERTIAGDAGVEQILLKGALHLSAVYFYTKLIDTVGFGNVVPDIGDTMRPFGGYLNQKGGISRGVELSGRLRPTSTTDIFASYTYTNSDQRTPPITGNANLETLGIPKNTFTLSATQRLRDFWVNVDVLATDSYLAPIFDTNGSTFQSYLYRFEGNRRADLTAGYTFLLDQEKVKLRVFGTMENLFDNEYFENGFRTPGRNGRIGVSLGF